MAKGYNLEQTGPQVQEAINKSLNLGPATQAKEGLMSAQDKQKLDSLDSELAGKVDKVPGKGLSTNDYDNTEKAKVASAYQKPVGGVPASDLAEGVIPDTSQFITKTVNDLANYYLKTETYSRSETYTKTEVDALIALIKQFSYQVVSELPEASESTMYKLYLVPSADPQTQNVKDEYITVRSGSEGAYTYAWEQIGSTAINLSGYVTTEALNAALANYTTTANLTTLLAAKQDVIADLSTIRTGAAAGATAVQPAEFNELKDEVDTIGNGSYEEAWDGDSTPVVADIPAGVVVTYSSASYTGTLAASASTVDKIYLVSDGNGNYDRYVTVESSGTYSWKKVGTTAIPLSDYATKAEFSQLEAKVTPISASLVDNSVVSQYHYYKGQKTKAIRRDSSNIVVFNFTAIETKGVYLKKGETIRFTLSSILTQGSSYDYFIWFAKASKFTESNENVSIIDGLSWATWKQNKVYSFEYTASQDCYFYITSDAAGTLTANKVAYDGGFGKEIDFLNLTEAEEQAVTTAPTGPGKIDVDGTIASSSASSLYHILLKGITRVYTSTAGSTGDTLAWATYDGAGNVKRLGPAVDKLYPSYMTDPAYLSEYEIDIQDGEELLVIAVGVGLENYFNLVLYGNEPIKERIERRQNDIVFGGNITDNENIYMWAGRLLNSVQLRKGIKDNVIFDLDAQGGAYGNPSDCTFSYDANNFYFAGTFANGGGNDIIGSTDCEVRLYIVPKSGQSYSYKTIVAKDIVITDKYGDSYTIQRGGSMANLIKSGNIFYIVFSTMIDGEFLEMRCKYDPSTDEVSDYCICKLANGENLSVKGLAASGYKLFPQSARVSPVTVNMNAYCQDAFDGTYFYIGACLANRYDYPFVLKTSDFETYEVFKQLVQNDCHATFECSTALLNGVLYTATRSLSKDTQFGYVVLNSVSVTTGEILSTAFVRDGICRPQLFKTTDGYIYLAHALDGTRQSGRIMRVSNLNGNLDYVADWMQVVQYAEFVANSDENTNTYYLFAYNRIYKVEIDKFTRYSGSANMIVTYAFPLIEAIAGLIS